MICKLTLALCVAMPFLGSAQAAMLTPAIPSTDGIIAVGGNNGSDAYNFFMRKDTTPYAPGCTGDCASDKPEIPTGTVLPRKQPPRCKTHPGMKGCGKPGS